MKKLSADLSSLPQTSAIEKENRHISIAKREVKEAHTHYTQGDGGRADGDRRDFCNAHFGLRGHSRWDKPWV